MKIRRENISVILHEPHFPENIGSAARAMKNMGFRHLVVVRPMDCDLTRILKTATHNAEDIVVEMDVYDSLREALAPFGYVVGTTARMGSHRQNVTNPRALVKDLIPVSQKNRVALLFGTESRGLSNEDLQYCDVLVNIPSADFSSLNLAQAVMVMLYELFVAERETAEGFTPRRANREELEQMYDHLTGALARINFINPENPEYWMRSIRRFFSRIGIRAREVKIVRGICRQIDWHCDKGDGEKGKKPEEGE